jgi:hypothetical protein
MASKAKNPLNKRFASKVIMFKKHCKLKKSIIMCSRRHKTMMLQQVPNLGYYKGNNFLLEPYCEHMCDKLVKRALVNIIYALIMSINIEGHIVGLVDGIENLD